MSKSRILFVISEVEGLAKTGGLADVGRALPIALKQQGHDIRIVMPYYQNIAQSGEFDSRPIPMAVAMGGSQEFCGIREGVLEDVPIYFIEHPHYFQRPQFYAENGHEYADNAERFGFFSKAALELCHVLSFQPDILHCNDWHTALVPFYLNHPEWSDPFFEDTCSILNIHNGAFQGRFPIYHQHYLQIPEASLNADLFEDYGMINFLKGGIMLADKLIAVSPGYAKELQTPLGGHGLDAFFSKRSEDLHGILNGCDYSQWDPQKDPWIAQTYDADNLAGKHLCKQALQKFSGLPQVSKVPLIGMVSRLTDQKGFPLVLQALPGLLQQDVQVVVLGTGDRWIEERLYHLAQSHPQKMAYYDAYDWKLSHQITAGSDLFLMPSLFEPCGLNQMYSLCYGTIPIVREVGGLKDSVKAFQKQSQRGTGFRFKTPSTEALQQVLHKALNVYQSFPDAFQKLQQRAMSQRFEWDAAAKRYERVYRTCKK